MTLLLKNTPFTTHDTTTSTMTTSSTTFETVPHEIISRILAYTMASTSPLHLQHFLDLGQKTHNHDPTYDNYDVDYHFRSHLLSRDWWFAQLDPSQKDHFLDWLLINGTCQRFSSLGKALFFSEKTFIISPALLRNLEEKKVRNLTVAATNRASSLITSVIVPISPVGAGALSWGLSATSDYYPVSIRWEFSPVHLNLLFSMFLTRKNWEAMLSQRHLRIC